MRVRLIKPARINHAAGEIVEVSPAQVGFLLSVGAVEMLTPERETPETAKKTTRKKNAK